MSYCRFTESSDVYAYECAGGVQFWVSGKADKGLDRLCNTFGEAYLYAKELRDEHGLNVPDTAIEELRADAIEEVKSTNGVIEELYDENAKMRELITFYLGCLTKGHVNCDSCAFSGKDNCDHGRKVIESAKQVGIEVS